MTFINYLTRFNVLQKSLYLFCIFGILGFSLLTGSGVTVAVAQSKITKPEDNSNSTRNAGARMELTIEGVRYAFRWCPAGKFMMGSPRGEEDRNEDETQHEVTLTQGFWMGETEVTAPMWSCVMKSIPYNKLSKERKLPFPITRVSWHDCEAFIDKLNKLGVAPSGFKFSLPTESQWEYACRAGTKGAYSDKLDNAAWYNSNSGPNGGAPTHRYEGEPMYTHQVGTKDENNWGLYDMHGNVWEWCNDWYGDYPTDSVIDPTGAANGGWRVYRGGCWYSPARSCRSAVRHDGVPFNRSISSPKDKSTYLGLRISLVSDNQ
ncbi:MAG: formylglycine-generating enzyme family protein [Planctomycetaceae bacterium]|jgi:formylglycine-generating enzyme required for sulfatase activity|nr:formylglycine-generating enzyme family protein [Planctomycetaceae bacterium]